MATIDVGSAATDRFNDMGVYTLVNIDNPTNSSGKITSIEIWAHENLSNCEVATFFVVSGNNLSTRDTHTIGDVTAGSKQTFSGLSLSVQVGDYIGIYFTVGSIEYTIGEGSGIWQYDGDKIPCTNQLFTFLPTRAISLYGTGVFAKSLAGSFTFTGSLGKSIKKALSGAFDFVGSVSSARGFKKALSGVLSFTPSLTVMIYYFWGKISKAIASYTKTDKGVSSYTKTEREESQWEKK